MTTLTKALTSLMLILPFILFGQTPELIFNSGFEPGTLIYDQTSGNAEITGVDNSVSAPNNWQTDFDNHPNTGYFNFQYEGGNATKRLAEIGTDPEDPTNQTLHFWIKEANSAEGVGRVQANIYDNTGITNLYYKTRLYLPADFNLMKNAPFRINFMTIMEFWNDGKWDGEQYPFRVSVRLQKLGSSPDSLRMGISGEGYNLNDSKWDNELWEEVNTAFIVPVEKWMTIEVNFIEGGCDGRVFIRVTPDGESPTTVFDIRDYTHHPEDPSPDGLADFNPLKLYSSKDNIDYFTDNGQLLQVHWDDFELWKDFTIAPEAECYSIRRGPYLQMATSTSMTLKWETRSSTDSKVWYGNNPSNLSQTVSSSTNTKTHELQISGLNPNTTYYYAVGDNNGVMAGSDVNHFFKTAPTPTDAAPIRIWALGDAGFKNDDQRIVRDAYYNHIGSNPTDLMLLLGDNAYENGTDVEYQFAVFDRMYEDLILNTTMLSTFGNHDANSSNSSTESGPYYDIFSFPSNAEAGGVVSGTEAYYSYDYGNIHIISLNSEDIDRSAEGTMMQWLQADLNANDKDWIIAIWHHAPYNGAFGNSSDTHPKSKEMRENALSVLESAGVDLVLAGHTHNYQRSYLINGHYGTSNTYDETTMLLDFGNGQRNGDSPYLKAIGGPMDGKGTVYLVSGTGGEATTDPGNHPVMLHKAKKLGSVAIEVDDLEMDVQFIDGEGDIEDHFTIIKQHEPPLVNITNPVNNQFFTSPQYLTIRADATDSNGSVTGVEFFINNISIGVDHQAPFSIDWTIPEAGGYYIEAIATDNEGNIGSSVIKINVAGIQTCSRIISSSDDAEESTWGAVSVNSSDLELVRDDSDQTVGLRFVNLRIPQGADVNHAYIQFASDANVNLDPCVLNIFGEAHDNAPAFSDIDNDITIRTPTQESIEWTPPQWTSSGAIGPAQRTVDIGPVVQEIVDRNGFTDMSALVIMLNGTGRRRAESYNGNPLLAPQICITYTPVCIADSDGDGICDEVDQCPGEPEPGTACDDGNSLTYFDLIDDNCNCIGVPFTGPPVSIVAKVNQSSDDAEENSSGVVNVNSGDLEIIEEDTDQLIGIRFSNLDIPQGAVIENAYIQFTTERIDNENPCQINVFCEATDDAVSFTLTEDNISSRPTTFSSVSWLPVPWLTIGASGISQRTSNLAPVIQQVVNRPGFSSGNAINFIFEGTGRRVAFSYDGEPNNAPELHVEYRCGASGPIAAIDPVEICPGEIIEATVSGGNAPYSWLWSDGSNNNSTIAADDLTTYIVTVTDDDGCFSEDEVFSTNVACGGLPVEWLSFTARETDLKHVLVNWATATEINNRHFTVERSADGSNFEPIGMVTGTGNTTTESRYQFIDSRPLPFAYYRLQQIDFDDQVTYSNIVSVALETTKEQRLTVFPSIASTNVTLRYKTISSRKSTLKVVDTFGRVILDEAIYSSEGWGYKTIDLSNYHSGLYYVNMTDGKVFSTAKFVVLERK